MNDKDIQHLQQELERLRTVLTKANNAASFMHEEPYRTMLGLSLGDNILLQGIPELKFQLDKTMQELERLRNENAALRRELYPPESPKKELKYWIVTGLSGTTPIALATVDWHKVLRTKLYLASNGFTGINILEQRVLL